jgi:hypothetical protein
MTLIVLLTLWNLVRLMPATPFNQVRQLEIMRAWQRFGIIGPFPVALLRRRVNAPGDEEIADMAIALVVGTTDDNLGAGLVLQITPDLAITMAQRRLANAVFTYHIYEIQGQINLTDDQINVFVNNAFDYPPDVGAEGELPLPATVPNYPVYFVPEPYAMDEEDEDTDDGNSDDDVQQVWHAGYYWDDVFDLNVSDDVVAGAAAMLVWGLLY